MKKCLVFLACLLAFFLLLDCALAYWGENACPWAANDFEATRLKHPEEVWDKVFYGNSAVISAYLEEESQSGYINLGIDYGVITDLREMLEHIRVGSELVIGLNFFTFCDEFDTNPAYIWHRRFYEPYSYFHRDKFMNGAKSLAFNQTLPQSWEKILYYGNLSDDELAEKMKTYEEEYFCRQISEFENNLAALEDIAVWCEENGVALRLVWMPYNPAVESPKILKSLQEQVGQWATGRSIAVLDLTDAMGEDCFHDVGHLNREHGAYVFTAKIDPWLMGEETMQ